jgi:hypothetical protein
MIYFSYYNIHNSAEYNTNKCITYVFHITAVLVKEKLIESDENVMLMLHSMIILKKVDTETCPNIYKLAL